MKISFFTLGCKLNQAETDELKKDLLKLGHFITPYDSEEDLCIVRGCGVTCSASQKTRNIIRHIKRQGAYVIVAGCVENKDLLEIDFVGKNNNEIVKHLKTKFPINSPKKQGSIEILERTRAFIKIQTGCNFNCAYCIIPSFRGRSESLTPKEIIEKINQAKADDYKEIVLTGVNVCQYNYHKNIKTLKHKNKTTAQQYNTDLTHLLRIILEKTKIQRIRLGSLDPRLISKKLMGLYTNELTNPHLNLPPREENKQPPSRGAWGVLANNVRLLPHWHLSLQSGSDTVLKRMNRNYTAKKYLDIISQLRKTYPLFSFTTDIIVGFPGETDKEFKETCEFVKKASFAKVHIFPFSPRPGTVAATMKNQVTDKIKTERAKKLTAIANQVAKKYAAQFKGLTRPVLFEHEVKGHNEGYTPEYLRVKIAKSKSQVTNQIVEVKM